MNSVKEEKLYIALVDTPGIFAYMIHKNLKQKYIHVVLSFDPKLSEAYSVGRRMVEIPFFAGFEREQIFRISRKYKGADYKIVELPCTKEQKLQVVDRLRKQYLTRFKIHYSIIGLIPLVFNKEFYHKNYYTCSSYIARVLMEEGIIDFNKHFSLVTPKDFYQLDLACIYEGPLSKFVEKLNEE